MASKYDGLARIIIQNVGGKENVIDLEHCITRLRFRLKDVSKANTAVLKATDGIVTVMNSGGQYQIVIGNHVPDVFNTVNRIGHLGEARAEGEVLSGQKQSFGAAFIGVITGTFQPILGAMTATGIIKGLLALFVFLGWTSTTNGLYQVLYAVSDSFFYFMPIFLGYTAMKKFNGNPFVGMAIGASMLYPTLTALASGTAIGTLFSGTIFQSSYFITILGIPVLLPASGSYASTVVPVILAVLFASKLEKWLKTFIPDVIKLFIVPAVTLAITVPLTFIVIGPVANFLCAIVGELFKFVFGIPVVGGLVAGLILGALWQVLVIFGLHWGLIPVMFINLSTLHYDYVLAPYFAASFAQSMVVLAIFIKTKDKGLKDIALPAFISGIFGVTEPCIYGITLPKKKPFVISCIASSIGGGIIGWAGVKIYAMGGLGLFALPGFIDATTKNATSMYWAIAGVVVASIVAFALTMITYKDEALVKKEIAKNGKHEEIASPLTGSVVQLSDIEDEAFSSGVLGQGVAVLPTIGKVAAPCDGTVSSLISTNHAIGILSDKGAEILIHIGMNTVKMNGEGFKALVSKGDKIKKGQTLIEFDIEKIKKAGHSLVAPVIVTNVENYLDIVSTAAKTISQGDTIITVL